MVAPLLFAIVNSRNWPLHGESMNYDYVKFHYGSRLKWLVRSASFIVASLFLTGSAGGQLVVDSSIEIDFEIKLVSFKDDGVSEKAIKNYRGECWLEGTHWFLRVHYMDNAVEELYFDGTNVTKKTSQFAEPKNLKLINERYGIADTHASSRQLHSTNVFIRVISGLHPLDNLWINAPWLAFCSGGYLAQPERIVPFPSGWTRHLPNAFGYEDKTTLLPGGLGLPLTCELYASSERFTSSPFDERLARTDTILRIRSHPRGIVKNGLLQFQYRVTASTNLQGRVVPSEFQFTEFRPTQDNNLGVKLKGFGRVLHFKVVSSMPHLRVEESKAVITDYRFRSQRRLLDSISYEKPRGQSISSIDDTNLQTLFLEAEKERPVDPTLVGKTRRMTIVIAVALLSLGLLMLWRFLVKNN